ncbi:ABC-type multidrug/protein/lipid transport system, ATPase component [Clostridium sp. SY8519]|nr:ABC-type multidrug/protein/lipid transport system, ATPase component [Clostridium sp. SY8519]
MHEPVDGAPEKQRVTKANEYLGILQKREGEKQLCQLIIFYLPETYSAKELSMKLEH